MAGDVSNQEPELLSPASFTELFVACLRQIRPELKIEVIEDLELKFSKPRDDRKPHQAFLDNAFTVYQKDPEARDEIIDQFIAGQLETLDKSATDDINPKRIIPVIKDRQWLEDISISLKTNAEFPIPLHDEYNSELQVIYAEDSEHNIRYLNGDNLDQLPCERNELLAYSTENLKDLLGNGIEVMGGDGIFMVTAGGNYETSLLLIHDLWTANGPMEVKGQHVVAIPTRDLLLVSGTDDLEGIARIREIAGEMIQENAYTLTPVLFAWNDGRFEVFEG